MHRPPGDRLLFPVILERGCILARLSEGKRTISLRSYVDRRRSPRIERKEVLEPGEVPFLHGRFGDREEIADDLFEPLSVGDGQRKVLIGDPIGERFGTVDGSVDFESDVKLGAGQELGLIRREHAAEFRTSACRDPVDVRVVSITR